MNGSWATERPASAPAQTHQEAVQSLWFLYVILQMEGNASSFSPGRMDQYLYPYFTYSRAQGMTLEDALEITECLWLNFNPLCRGKYAALERDYPVSGGSLTQAELQRFYDILEQEGITNIVKE